VRYDRGVIESFVDLTYRGLSLGRRVRLSQVRPSAGYLELPAPMPVGAQIAILAEDGTAFDAVVTAIHEQVAGSDRTPGMTVSPALAAAPAAAWWAARVSLPESSPESSPENDAPRPRPVTPGRSRPATVRPRSHTDPAPPSADGAKTGGATEGPTDKVPTIIADLDARVTAAAGLAPRPDGDRSAMRTMVMPLAEIEALTAASGGADEELDPAILHGSSDHAVHDDGKRTVLMERIDPAALGIDLAAVAGVAPAEHADGEGDGDDADDADADGDPGDTLNDASTAPPARGRRKRRSRR
jgi:hypothetical protein